MTKKSKKLTRMLAVILTLTMLMSAMMVQAFAAVKPETGIEPCASGTFQGYNIGANFVKTSTGKQMNCSAQSGINMGIYAEPANDTIVQLKTTSGTPKHATVYRSGTYFGMDVTIPIPLYATEASDILQFAYRFPVIFGYNGLEYSLVTTTTFY